MSAGPSMSLIENNQGGIGHYKGVMLCNRPFAGTQATNQTKVATESNTFTCGVVPAAPGMNVPISMKEKMIKRPKKDSVLVKHKRWLAELQKNKERAEEEYLEEMRRKEESLQQFQEHQKKLREYTRTLLGSSSSQTNLAESKNPESGDIDVKGSAKDDAGADAKEAKSSSSDAKESKKTAINRPAWALTESSAELASDAKQTREEDELLDFAKSLNYDRYIADMEVKLMMERLRKRIEELEKEVAAEDQREADAELRAARREMLELMGNAESSLKTAEEENPDDVALNTAKALLEEDEGMQAVHSTKSVVQLLKTAKEKIASVRSSVKPEKRSDLEPKVVNEPKVVFHEPNEGARLDGKNAISNLPYMHRNPAV